MFNEICKSNPDVGPDFLKISQMRFNEYCKMYVLKSHYMILQKTSFLVHRVKKILPDSYLSCVAEEPVTGPGKPT